MGQPKPKHIIPDGYLARPGGRWRNMKLLHMAVMIYHVQKAARDPEVGFLDADRTLAEMKKRLNRLIFLDPRVIESALWACNLLNEKGKFEGIGGMSFDEWLADCLPHGEFDKTYNLIKWKDGHNAD